MYVISSISGGRRSSSMCDPCGLGIRESFRSFPSSGAIFIGTNSSRENSGFARANVDWKETPEAHVFKADLPGLKKEQVKVEVEEEGRVLKISGERSREPGEKSDKYHHLERSSGKFRRRFRLPEDVTVDAISADMENGVLTVTVPKREQKKPQLRTVEISG